MAAAHRGIPADLKTTVEDALPKALQDRAKGFSFFQAVRLLHHVLRERGSAGGAEVTGGIRVRPNLSLAFPSSDIDDIETIGDGHDFRITANFLGLYGCGSPLPTFYTEDLLDEAAQDESVSREFLDIINQRLYDLLYQGWLKHRQFFLVAENRDPRHLERLYCLLGLGAEPLRRYKQVPGGNGRLLRYIGLFTQHPRSAEGLAALLRDALQGIGVTIVPCLLRKADIPPSQQMRMGVSGSRLGVDSYLGCQIDDRMGKFRIRVGPLDRKQFFEFTPGNEHYELLAALTDSYLTEPLAYEIELVLAAGEARTTALGDPARSLLGVTTWVFSESQLGEVRTRFNMQRA